MDPRIGLIFDGIISACRTGWRRLVRHRAEDTIPIISCDGGRDLDHTGEDGVSTQRKSWFRLARLSGTVCGIEFCYAAETAFVSPILLRIGIPQRFMTMIWCLSPLLGFFVMPFLGSASDRCSSRLGRRRPFILLLSAIIFIGLLLVPNGYRLGLTTCGHHGSSSVSSSSSPSLLYRNYSEEYASEPDIGTSVNKVQEESTLVTSFQTKDQPSYIGSSLATEGIFDNITWEMTTPWTETVHIVAGHACGVVFTILGVAFLDFSCDACQSPSRAYLIDVTHPSDHTRGLAIFSFMAGFGGAAGYLIGGIPWGQSSSSAVVGAHVRYVFGLITIIFVVALILTITSEREQTLAEINPIESKRRRKREGTYGGMDDDDEEVELGVIEQRKKNYGSRQTDSVPTATGTVSEGTVAKREAEDVLPLGQEAGKDEVPNGVHGARPKVKGGDESDGKMGMYQTLPDMSSATKEAGRDEPEEIPTIGTYLLSIVFMPPSLRILCFTHLLGWMSLLCYSLYFTDFMGQEVYGGDPFAPPGSRARQVYADGVRKGSYAMALYSITCSITSLCTEWLIRKIGAKWVYVGNQAIYCVSMALMAAIRTPWAAFLFSATAGIEYSTLFTLPFILIANYHSTDTFYKTKSVNIDEDESDVEDVTGGGSKSSSKQVIRGLGTDVSLVQSMVFVAQFFLSLCMGSIVHAVGSTTAIVVAASVLSGLGALAATQVLYAGL